MNNINKLFDKIYCLTTIDRNDRLEYIQSQITKLNIDVEIYQSVKYNIPLLNINELIYSDIPGNSSAILFTMFNHYSIIKKSLFNNYQHIFIFEDDIYFNDNVKLVYDTFNNIPNDYDILRLCYPFDMPELYDPNKYFIKKDLCVWGTQAYALSFKGMKYYIDYLDNQFCQADLPLYDITKIKENKLNNYYCSNNIIIHNKNIKSNILI